MSSRAFRAAGDGDDDALFPNIEGLGVGDTVSLRLGLDKIVCCMIISYNGQTQNLIKQ